MEYYKMNANPKEKKTGDCVVRAITLATTKSWEEVLTDLFNIAIEEKEMLNSKKCYEKLLENYGFIKYKQPRFSDRTKYQVRELADALPKSEIVISVANHMTYVSKGTLYDTWDCGRKSVGNYWIKAGGKQL